MGDFGESEIVYKIETPVWMSGFDNQTTVSILKQGSKTVDWMSGEITKNRPVCHLAVQNIDDVIKW